jgi:hypothetical protein
MFKKSWRSPILLIYRFQYVTPTYFLPLPLWKWFPKLPWSHSPPPPLLALTFSVFSNSYTLLSPTVKLFLLKFFQVHSVSTFLFSLWNLVRSFSWSVIQIFPNHTLFRPSSSPWKNKNVNSTLRRIQKCWIHRRLRIPSGMYFRKIDSAAKHFWDMSFHPSI